MSSTTENKPVPTKRPVPEDTTYMGYYRLDNHDAQCLQVGDRIIRMGSLVTVTDVQRKRGETTITLSDGFRFDPRFDAESNNKPWLQSITFFRPRRAFSASPISTQKAKTLGELQNQKVRKSSTRK
jgi:hypothetical protein